MPGSDTDVLTTLEEVRARMGQEVPAVRQKVFERLESTAKTFIARSPLALLATSDAAGHPDVTPRGDAPGFTIVEGDDTLLLPERKGNRMILALRNLLENPNVALIFLVPGTEETLRIHGRATLVAEPELLGRLSARGAPALLAIRVHVQRVFFHCAKAFRRSRLWRPESWPEPVRISFGDLIASRIGGDEAMARRIDHAIEEDYANNL